MPTVESLLGSRSPLVAAPMAGGVSGPRLAAAVADAGGFPFLAAGYKGVAALADEISACRELGGFGVNVFVPDQRRVSRDEFRRYARELQPEAEPYGIDLGDAEPVADDDGWREKLDLLRSDPVPVVSFTFGLPDRTAVRALQRVGSVVVVSVTTVEEARAAADSGADAVVAQGSAAGGHSATFDPYRPIVPSPTEALVRDVVAATGLPVLAAGGVDGPHAVRDVLAAGASGVVVGTLLLRTDESGASDLYKGALADPRFTETRVTRAFTGRPARALTNGFVRRHDATAPTGYPAIHHLTLGIRRAAAAAGDVDRVHLWAGTGYRSAQAGPVRAVLDGLLAIA